MTQAELYNALKETGLPVRYHHFKEPPNPPYMVYLFSYSSDFMADNINYQQISNFQIELYSDHKDLESEALVENKLKELSMPYQKIETWIDTEELYQVIYEIQLI